MEKDPIVDRGNSDEEAAAIQLVIEGLGERPEIEPMTMEERRLASLKARQAEDLAAYRARPDWEGGFSKPDDYPGSTPEYQEDQVPFGD